MTAMILIFFVFVVRIDVWTISISLLLKEHNEEPNVLTTYKEI